MLSTRSLAKIAKQQEQKAAVASSERETAREAAAALAAAEATRERRVQIVEPSSESQAIQFECPSPKELAQRARQVLWVDARKAGVYDLLFVLCVGALTMYVLEKMYVYLQETWHLKLPDTQSLAHLLFDFADHYPVIFLTLNFAIAGGVGQAFLYRSELTEWMTEARAALRKELAKLRGAARRGRRRTTTEKPTTYAPLVDEESGEAQSPQVRFEGSPPSRARNAEVNGGMGDAAHRRISREGSVDGSVDGSIDFGESVDGGGSVDGSVDGGPPDYNDLDASQAALLPAEARQEQRNQLRLLCDQVEELEIKTQVLKKKGVTTPAATEARTLLKELSQQRDALRAVVHPNEKKDKGGVGKAGDAEKASDVGGGKSTSRDNWMVMRLLRSALVQVLFRSANGIFSVGLYFADLISDIQVAVLLLKTGNAIPRHPTPSHAISRHLTPSHAISRHLTPSRASHASFSSYLTPSHLFSPPSHPFILTPFSPPSRPLSQVTSSTSPCRSSSSSCSLSSCTCA